MASDTPAGQPATLPAAAVQAGRLAARGFAQYICSPNAWDVADEIADDVLEAAAPHLAAATLNDFRHTTRDDYQDTYRDWWAGIVEHPDGSLNRDQVARELADYAALMQAASEVYCAVTNGRISKPNTLPQAVIGQAEECAQELADEAEKRAAELHALATEILSRWETTRAKPWLQVPPEQRAKWQAVLDGGSGE